MLIPLIVNGSINCEPTQVLVPKGKWKVESNEKESVLALHFSDTQVSIKNGQEIAFDKDTGTKLSFMSKGKEDSISVYLRQVQ